MAFTTKWLIQLGDSKFYEKNQRTRKCFSIKDEDRKLLFTTFWSNLLWNERKTYVAILCHIEPTAVNMTGYNNSRRSSTVKYLKINNEMLQVYKKIFLLTLGLNEWPVRN